MSMARLPLALAVVLLWSAQPAAALEVSENRECATCHVMWLSDFKRKDVTPLIPYEPRPRVDTGRQDVASTERMCFSCHDGFTLDSREVWRGGAHGHPVGVAPSDKVRIPTSHGKVVFPLNDDGKMYCGTCHTAHGVDWNEKESPLFMRVKNVDSSMCFACHLDRSTGPAEGNHPVFATMEKFPDAVRRAGGKPGRKEAVICQSCHRAHGGARDKMLVLPNDDSRLCGACHADKYRIRTTKHDMAIMAPDSRNLAGKKPTETGPCGVCHLPHKARGPALWARELAAGADPMSGRCLSCHNPEGLAKDKTVGTHSHPVNVPITRLDISTAGGKWSTRFAGKDLALTPLPLYDEHGLRGLRSERVACGTCHDPHSWSPTAGSAASTEDPRKIEGDGSNSFLRIAVGRDSALCANCHTNKSGVVASKHNLQRVRAGHEPPKGAVCDQCHAVHNAKGAQLWARDLGQGDGHTERLCTSCHRAGGEAAERLLHGHGHPVNVALKPDMIPRLPLYDARGARANEGKVECGTCHDAHQWNPKQPMTGREVPVVAVEGDARTSFLRMDAGARPELCAECHATQARVRGTDHDLNVTAPKARNQRGQTVEESGVCGACHAVHLGKEPLRLWARTPGPGANPSDTLCRGCHTEQGVAAAKVPQATKHPQGVAVWGQALRLRYGRALGAGLPLFDPEGRPSEFGAVACATCHDPHQWSARQPGPGPGRNIEGDVSTSFLRLGNTASFVCSDCHGLDSVYRYKYFHGASSHRKYPMAR